MSKLRKNSHLTQFICKFAKYGVKITLEFAGHIEIMIMKFSFNIKTILILMVCLLIPAGIAKGAAKKPDFVVIIDAGHGGHDTGAVDNGVKEKDINLAVAKKLSSDIQKKTKNVKVVMTRSNDTFISLQERANIANRNKGNLFISIHTNSVDAKNPNRKSVCGTNVYALGLHKDENNLKVAQRENSVIELEPNFKQKYSGFDPSKDESYIIFEMSQKKNLGQSLKFASHAQKNLVNTAGRKDRGVKQAGFWVLWATSMPSVLVELDFICNPTSAGFMGSDEGQKLLAKALGDAVNDYVDAFRSKNNNLADISILEKNDISEEFDNTEESVLTAETVKADSNSKTVYSAAATVVKKERNDTPPTVASSKNYTTSRRRRSKSAREASQRRVVETGNIPLHYEADYLAKVEKAEPVKVVEEKKVEIKETPKERKKRLALERRRNKNNKSKSDNKTLTAQNNEKEKSEVKKENKEKSSEKKKNKNNKTVKTFVVTKEGHVSMETASNNKNMSKEDSNNSAGSATDKNNINKNQNKTKEKRRVSLNSRRNSH